ncbi:MAG: zinc ribbon domain-containing protein [Ruminococcaceae bacterium]|nr:zinc ribbon domain-containing protein [Oscillospiraceae bacterium]
MGIYGILEQTAYGGIHMPFCTNCGTQVRDTAAFCHECGKAIKKPNAGASASGCKDFNIDFAPGKETVFSLCGQLITISPEMDAFNNYRKQFSRIARIKANDLRNEYWARITNLDSFLTVFPEIYSKHRKPLIDTAMRILAQADIYDISPEQFESQHTADFCLCGEDVDVVIESFNKTIEANQDKKIKVYNMMPGMVFHGLGGFAAALAVNAAVNTIAEIDIKNANVTQKQRAELFGRINLDLLMERAYIDYWRVFLSLTFRLNQRGFDVWYPNEQDNNRANGLYQNLTLGRIPPEKVLSQVALLLNCNPYTEGCLDYLTARFGITLETQAIASYLSV